MIHSKNSTSLCNRAACIRYSWREVWYWILFGGLFASSARSKKLSQGDTGCTIASVSPLSMLPYLAILLHR